MGTKGVKQPSAAKRVAQFAQLCVLWWCPAYVCLCSNTRASESFTCGCFPSIEIVRSFNLKHYCVCLPVCLSEPCHINEEEAAWAQVSSGSAALREARAELSEARRQWHTLQVEIETLHALVGTTPQPANTLWNWYDWKANCVCQDDKKYVVYSEMRTKWLTRSLKVMDGYLHELSLGSLLNGFENFDRTSVG